MTKNKTQSTVFTSDLPGIQYYIYPREEMRRDCRTRIETPVETTDNSVQIVQCIKFFQSNSNITANHIHTHTWFWFSQYIVPQLHQVRSVPTSNLGTAAATFYSPSCLPINHNGSGTQEGCIGCLDLRLQGSIPPVTITMFLTWRQHVATKLSW